MRAIRTVIRPSAALVAVLYTTVSVFAGGQGGHGGFNADPYGFSGQNGNSATGRGGDGGRGDVNPYPVGVGGAVGSLVTSPTVINSNITGGTGGRVGDQDAYGANGGGGGGTGVATSSDVTNNATIIGGRGGEGAVGVWRGASGGGGGGAGVATSANFTNNAVVTGGAGGVGVDSISGQKSGGGGGGAGVYVVGNGALVTITNKGTVTGGTGGANSAWRAFFGGAGGAGEGGAKGSARVGDSNGASSQGGVGIVGANISVINDGTIVGGVGGTGGSNAWARNDAVTFQSGVNNLTLTTKSVVTGAVNANGNDTLTLQNSLSEADGGQSGSKAISVTQYKGFEHLVVNGGRWTFDGALISKEATLNGGAVVVTGPAVLGVQPITAQGGAIEASGRQVLGQSFVLNNNPYGAGTSGLVVQGGNNLVLSGVLSGDGRLTKNGSGTLTLSGANTYTGGTKVTAGTLAAGSDSNLGGVASGLTFDGGTLQVTGTGWKSTNRAVQLEAGGGTFNIDNAANNFAVTEGVTGTGDLTKSGAGALTLSGDSRGFTGTTTVSNGSLLVNGSLGGTVTVNSGATLGGSGVLDGNTTVNGTLEGTSSNGLTFNGDLRLGSGTIINASFDRPGGARIFDVKGNIVLDGTVNVSSFGTGGPGLYHLFHHDGTRSGGGLTLGTLPGGVSAANVYINQQANDIYVVNTNGANLNYWNGTQPRPQGDGRLHGGDGSWTAVTTGLNWTDSPGYALNGAWTNDAFAVFGGTKGLVTVDTSAGAISASGMQFITTDYKLSGGTLTLVPTPGGSMAKPVIRVGDGGAGDSAITTTVSTVLAGTHGMEKANGGTLILTGVNTYTGGTAISGGTLQLGDGTTNGSVQGAISTGADAAHKGVLAIHAAAATPAIIDNTISGEGSVSVLGGTVTLSGANTYTGGTTLAGGTTIVTADANLGAAGSDVVLNNGATLRFGANLDAAHSFTHALQLGTVASDAGTLDTDGHDVAMSGVLSGAGDLTKSGAG
ncbi:beta strand repeat-containing protein, partial [Brucella sp. 83/13]|uniref:beta strand repeat-containing protein n=1 Tax=Brucella sp. 83/13 TaxID=520449 RepID=UPI0035291B79